MSIFKGSLDLQEREVSATRKEYEYGLNQAVPGCVHIDGDSIFISRDGVRIRIDISPMPDLQIALLRLSRLKATWNFLEGSEEAKAKLVDHIDWSMKRGGG